jgi:hypothetical protein
MIVVVVGQLFKLQRRFHRRSSRRAAQPQEGRLETDATSALRADAFAGYQPAPPNLPAR